MNLLESDVIWRNGRLATMSAQSNAPYGLLDRHALVVRDKHIIAVIPEDELPTQHPQQIDLQNRLVTPGLIDCHTHLVFGGDRAYEWEQRLNGVSYTEISQKGGGINSTVRATRDASPDTLLSISQQRLQALMDEGVTTVEMKSGYGLDLINEEKQLRVAQQLARQNAIDVSPTLLSAHTTPPEYHGRSDHYIDLICEEILPQLWEKKLFESVDVFCESVGFSVAQSEKLFTAAKQLGIPVRGHMEQLSNLGGSELVARYHGLSTDHIEHLDEAGIQALARSQTVAVLLPGAFYFYAKPNALRWIYYVNIAFRWL
ncbi:Imidazolonepropionase [Hafnia alvei]|nr:Imidazolonepropionase [Hafnia alvei]